MIVLAAALPAHLAIRRVIKKHCLSNIASITRQGGGATPESLTHDVLFRTYGYISGSEVDKNAINICSGEN